MSQTKHQHYISQVDQRLNTSTPDATPENQRIFSFDLIDRDARIVRLTHPRGRPIASNLSMYDLYSFDVDKDAATRANLEREFGQYETVIRENTQGLMRKFAEQSDDCKEELLTLFLAKMTNFIRNPFSVQKVLNTFGAMAVHHPTDPAIYASYTRIMTGRKPQQAALSARLGITDEQYATWLRVIFMLLTPMAGGQPNFLEQMMKNLFENENHEVIVQVHRFDDQACLLCDRGISWPLDHAEHLVFDFNLSSAAFVRFAFMSHDTFPPGGMPPMIRAGLKRGPKRMHVLYELNDLQSLTIFHHRVIDQCYEKVYCSTKTPYGVTVLSPA
jgi:hypothetical protein